MRFLFVHQNFPGQFLHLVRHLLAAQRHDVVFICEPNANVIPGVRKITYQLPPRQDVAVHPDARDLQQAVVRAEAVAKTARQLKDLGFEPEIIIGHHGWGELLNLCDVWPDAPLLGYHEFFYNTAGYDVGFDPEFPTDPVHYPGIRAKNAVNLLALANRGHGQTPTRFQLGTYPAWAQPSITVLPEGVNLDICRPNPELRGRVTTVAGLEIRPNERLITYVSRDLEPYRGFHVMMRAVPHILRAQPNARVVMVGGDGVSYGARLATGNWRELFCAQAGPSLDPARVHFPGKIGYADYVRLLQRSDAHVYLTYPFVASWSLREALACGCALVASDTAPVREFVTDGETGLLTPFSDARRLAERVNEALEGGEAIAAMRSAARGFAETHLRMDDHIAQYERLIERLTA
jgi:glycosyltransferase involved in cell wall biosynthesis